MQGSKHWNTSVPEKKNIMEKLNRARTTTKGDRISAATKHENQIKKVTQVQYPKEQNECTEQI